MAKVHCSGPVLDKMVATDETHKDRESNFTPQTLQNCLSRGKAPGKFSVRCSLIDGNSVRAVSALSVMRLWGGFKIREERRRKCAVLSSV